MGLTHPTHPPNHRPPRKSPRTTSQRTPRPTRSNRRRTRNAQRRRQRRLLHRHHPRLDDRTHAQPHARRTIRRRNIPTLRSRSTRSRRLHPPRRHHNHHRPRHHLAAIWLRRHTRSRPKLAVQPTHRQHRHLHRRRWSTTRLGPKSMEQRPMGSRQLPRPNPHRLRRRHQLTSQLNQSTDATPLTKPRAHKTLTTNQRARGKQTSHNNPARSRLVETFV